jgi:hypothetical protein
VDTIKEGQQDGQHALPDQAQVSHLRFKGFRVAVQARINQNQTLGRLNHVRSRWRQTAKEIKSRHNRCGGSDQAARQTVEKGSEFSGEMSRVYHGEQTGNDE